MQLELLATRATFWDFGTPGVRMVSVALGAPVVSHRRVHVRSVAEARAAFDAFTAECEAQGVPFRASAAPMRGSRAVFGWSKIGRLIHNYDPEGVSA